MDQPEQTFSYSSLTALRPFRLRFYAGPPPHKYYVRPPNCEAPLIHMADCIDLKFTAKYNNAGIPESRM